MKELNSHDTKFGDNIKYAELKDCIDYIENIRHIKLFDYQKEILKCFLEGKPVITARGCGRSFVAKLYGDYTAHLVDKNDYEAEGAVKIPWTEVILDSELYSANYLKYEKEVNLDLFNKEYELK